jgi:pyruvate/2-oxoglutarate dehydrogenase complex dihydrolipoamide dehydrogenase (E3) component
MSEQVDVVVIGMGPGGEEVAGSLAQAGLRVVGIEKKLLGGECPYWGCVPSKMMIRAADLLAEAGRVPVLAGRTTVEPDWTPVARRIREEATDTWNDRVAVDRFQGKGGIFVRGEGRLVGPGQVAVGDRVFAASRGVVIATGTEPAVPPIPGLREVPYWTNREAIEAEALPTSLAVLGGGAVGLELAQVFARFGVRVTVIEMEDHLLPLEEPEAGELLARLLREEGLDVRTGTGATRVRRDGDRTVVELDGDDAVAAERLLVATGRRANLPRLGLEHVGLDPNVPFIPVDDHLRAAPRVWAVGDVTGKGLFTHMAVYQAGIAIADILGRELPAADYRTVPRVTFTDPEVGAAGITEAVARGRGLAVRVGTAQVPVSARGWIHGIGNQGLIKLVEDAERQVLVGALSVGPTGGEVLSMLALAIHASVPVAELERMIYAYPTFHRGVEDALRDLRTRAPAPVR